ncbi:MAG: GerMN domain-containing protein [Spirochaetaceae bacterium]|jgi:spore germination protein GerM|nr:GerMN domain-containing protein [Spirochaetaceae bacterium]
MAEPKKKNSAAFGCLFWIACILLIIVVFFVRRDEINRVLRETGFLGNVFNQTTETDTTVPPNDEDFLPLTILPEQTEPGAAIPAPVEPPSAVVAPVDPPPVELPPEDRPITLVTGDEIPAAPQSPSQEDPEAAPSIETVLPPPAEAVQVKTRDTRLYFIEIDSGGKVVRRSVTRKIPVSDTPLMDSLRALFNGTNGDEAGKSLISLIPPRTRLISASVKGGVATINMSEEFRFNQYGAEGLIGQLMQVVYTATEFSTVTSVQILIEGQRKEYLSGDGIWIGTPLSRESF